MIREYKIKIDDELLKGYTPIAFRIPEPNEHCVLQGGIAIFPAGERSVPRMILSPPKPEPVEQPPTLPDGWELAEPEKRTPAIGEWFIRTNGEPMERTGYWHGPDKRWIIRRKPDPATTPSNMLLDLSRKLASCAGDLADAAQIAEDAATAMKAVKP